MIDVLSQKFKEDALRALEDMSAEELVSVLKKIGSVQESTISIEISFTKPSKFNVAVKEEGLPATEQQIMMKKPLRYQFELPKMVDVLPQWGEAV